MLKKLFFSRYTADQMKRGPKMGGGRGAFFAFIFIPHTICQPCSLLKTFTFKISFSASPGITKSPSEYVNVFHDGIDLWRVYSVLYNESNRRYQLSVLNQSACSVACNSMYMRFWNSFPFEARSFHSRLQSVLLVFLHRRWSNIRQFCFLSPNQIEHKQA